MPTNLLHTFQVDVTPPIGTYLCGGLHQQAIGVETPLYLRGVVFSANGTRYVIAGIDYCYLCGRSQQRLVEALAQGAGVPADHAALHSNHVHDAPLIDEEAHAVLAAQTGVQVHDEKYFSKVLADTRDAIRAALAKGGTPLGGIAMLRHPVERFASCRRVVDEHGKCHVRWSVCRDEWVRSQPEGRIDPDLHQIVLYDTAKKPAACLHFYTSHPQVSDGRRMISSDTVGVALDLFERNNPGVFSVYFAGCAGDITAGKYTTTNRLRNRLVFGVRLYDGMQGAFDSARPQAIQDINSIGWTNHQIDVPLSRVEQTMEQVLADLKNPDFPVSRKYLAAMKLDRLNHPKKNTHPFRLTRLRLGGVNILMLPTELVSDYQFHAKARCPGPLAIAAYSDSYLKYVATDEDFDEGGYEVEPLWSEVEKGIEQPILKAIDEILSRPV